jgi:phosphotransferase system enzyme I (PtsI)
MTAAPTPGRVTLTGTGVSPGIATAPVARLAPPPAIPAELAAPADPATETRRARAAIEAVAADLETRSASAAGEAADILTALALMVRDPSLGDKVAAGIAAGAPAPVAVRDAVGEFAAMLEVAGGYLGERAADLLDLRDRLIASLLGLPMPGIPHPGRPYVLVATDLSPADTATLDADEVVAIITERGGATSHTAIISKALGLPAVVGCAGAARLTDGDVVLVDGTDGQVVVDPEPALVASRLGAMSTRRAAAARYKGPGRTADGHPVQLLLNIGREADLTRVASVDAEGVGLFRTEFLFLERAEAPTVEEQRAAYREVFEAFTGRKVVVRTLDAGADKPLAWLTTPDEANPALGVRGLRTARRHPELLDGQLQAIARAARGSGADVWVMAPMVATAREAAAFADAVHGHGLPVAGAMIEVPAAALRAASLLDACDFASLGTNDLAQYAFAADRLSADLADLLDPWEPALLSLIGAVGEAGRTAGKPVGVCGEAASVPLLALVLVGLGATSLSTAPVSLAQVRAALATHSLEHCRKLAAEALAAADGQAARAAVQALAADPR